MISEVAKEQQERFWAARRSGRQLPLAEKRKMNRERFKQFALPKGAIVNSPLTGRGLPFHTVNAEKDCVLGGDVEEVLDAVYIRGADFGSPYIYPLNGDMGGLPPVHVTVAQEEVLYDDSIMLSERLKACGVPCVLRKWPQMHHAFVIGGSPEAVWAAGEAADFILSL